MEYLSPQGVLLPLVYGTTASPLWLELRGRSAWQATPSWTVYRLACHRLHPWLRVTFAMVPDAAWPGSDQQPWSTAPATGPVGRLGRPSVSDPWGVGSFLSPGRPTCVRRLGPPGSCSPVCLLGVLCCVCGVLGLPAPVHRCARSVCCVACAASWASRLVFTGVPARCVVLRVRRPGPPGSCSPVCLLGVLCCVCGVLGLPAPVHRCARSVCCVACAASWASRLLFTGVTARCVVLRVRRPGPPGSCSPVCPLGVLCCVCGILGLPAPVHRCARSVCCVACAVSWASRLLFTGVPARCVVLRVRRPGPPGSCSPVCPLGVLCCVCGVLGLPAPVHRCARSVCCVACAASWASRLLFTGVPARCVVLRPVAEVDARRPRNQRAPDAKERWRSGSTGGGSFGLRRASGGSTVPTRQRCHAPSVVNGTGTTRQRPLAVKPDYESVGGARWMRWTEGVGHSARPYNNTWKPYSQSLDTLGCRQRHMPWRRAPGRDTQQPFDGCGSTVGNSLGQAHARFWSWRSRKWWRRPFQRRKRAARHLGCGGRAMDKVVGTVPLGNPTSQTRACRLALFLPGRGGITGRMEKDCWRLGLRRVQVACIA